jgi:ATP-binding cassette subfamily B protein
MRIKAGEKIALVGHNGAGKTTLVKLLLRFYDPDSGELYFNGKNIKDYNLESYRNLFGTVFQDFQIYSFSAMENILMDRSCDEYRKDVKEILELIKVSVDPDNALSKEFDKEGIVLSGGQSQKIAIARALIQDSPVLILDEPSSSLDPISEYEMNQYLFELAKDKTVIFISHRLSTTVMADRIYLLENGEIIEVGSHSELLNRNGKYADMFHKQAEKYIDNRNAKDD